MVFESRIKRALLYAITLELWVCVGDGLTAPLSPPRPDVSQLFNSGKYVEVIKILQEAVARNPRDAEADLWLARCYWELGDYDQTVAYAERASRLEPGSSQTHLWLGRAFGMKAEHKRSIILAGKARQEFEAAVRLNPGNLLARRDLMEFYLAAPRILGGSKVKAWQQAEAIAVQDSVEGHLAHGAFWQSTQQLAQAELEYRKIFELSPGRGEPYFEVAEFYQSRNDAARMEAATEAASRIKPDDPRLAYYRGVARILDGQRLIEAEQLLKSYLSEAPRRSDFPSPAAAHVWLGRLYERWGKFQPAGVEYRSALRLDPGLRQAQEALRHLHVNP